jgi:hypothetical protein
MEGIFPGFGKGTLLIVLAVAALIHLLLIFGTVGLAAEKNRKPILWLTASLFFSPITFLLMLFIGYAPRHHGSR